MPVFQEDLLSAIWSLRVKALPHSRAETLPIVERNVDRKATISSQNLSVSAQDLHLSRAQVVSCGGYFDHPLAGYDWSQSIRVFVCGILGPERGHTSCLGAVCEEHTGPFTSISHN